MSAVVRLEGGGNVIAAGRVAWERFKAAEAAGLEQLLDVGRALVAGRRTAMAKAGADRPAGHAYNAAFRAWCAANGFEDVPRNWRMDLAWCAEHEAEVRAAYAAQAATRTRSRPSINPRTLRQAVAKIGRDGPPQRRRAPTVQAMSIGALCDGLAQRLSAQPSSNVRAEVAALVAVLEAALRE